MYNIVSYRPHVIANGTAFEAQAKIYKYLQIKYNWKFIIIKADSDNFEDDELEIISVKDNLLSTIKGTNKLIHPHRFNKQIIQKVKHCDIVLGCDPVFYNQGLIAKKISEEIGAKLIYDASVTNMGLKKTLKWKIQKRAVEKALDHASLILITVPKVAERFADIGFEKESIFRKMQILGHPVETKKEIYGSKNRDKITILTVSRLVMEKGIHYIVESLIPLLKNYDNIELQIVGNGNAKGFIERIIVDKNIQKNVKFIESVEHKNIGDFYNDADILVTHPIANSKWEEFFGVVNLEGMSYGIPVVSTNNGGIPYVIRDQNVAELINERDVAGLTKVLEKLIKDENYRIKIGRAGAKFVEDHYSIELISDVFKKSIERLFNNDADNTSK